MVVVQLTNKPRNIVGGGKRGGGRAVEVPSEPRRLRALAQTKPYRSEGFLTNQEIFNKTGLQARL